MFFFLTTPARRLRINPAKPQFDRLGRPATAATGHRLAAFQFLFLAIIALLILASCTPQPVHFAPLPPKPAAVDAATLSVLLVAGDGSAPVFRNAVLYMRDKLLEAGVPRDRIRTLSDEDNVAHDNAADLKNVLAAASELNPPRGGSCLVFFTSHGVHHRGLYLGNKDEILRPEELNTALENGCGKAPTAVVISSCYAGRFAEAPMTKANRVIITGSATDRSSFGCSADDVLTYFDDCLLGSLSGPHLWTKIFENTRQCVALREDHTDMPASEPRSWFGSDVRNLSTPFGGWQDDQPAMTVRFTPGSQSYQPRRVPLATEDRAIVMPTLKQYARSTSPKALAYAPFGFAEVSSQETDPGADENDVARLALQRCEWLTGGACVLYARDGSTVRRLPSGLPPYHPAMLHRTGHLSAATTPFIRDDQRPRIENYIDLSGNKVLALGPGESSIGIGQGNSIEAARKSAMGSCQRDGADCVIYAEGDQVVLGW